MENIEHGQFKLNKRFFYLELLIEKIPLQIKETRKTIHPLVRNIKSFYPSWNRFKGDFIGYTINYEKDYVDMILEWYCYDEYNESHWSSNKGRVCGIEKNMNYEKYKWCSGKDIMATVTIYKKTDNIIINFNKYK